MGRPRAEPKPRQKRRCDALSYSTPPLYGAALSHTAKPPSQIMLLRKRATHALLRCEAAAKRLELRDVHVQGSIEAKGRRQGGDDLGDQAVQVGVGGSLDVQVAAADVIERLVVVHDGHVRVLQQGVNAEHLGHRMMSQVAP